MSANSNTSRIAALDGLRALAIILVFLRHAFKPFEESLADAFTFGAYNILTPFINGWVGVDLFFVLSGFLITRSFFVWRLDEHTLRRYALKRILRIVPAYYAMLIISVIIITLSSGDSANMGWRFLYHAAFLQDYLPSDINVVFWSLGVEEKFYIIAFFLLPFIFQIHEKASMKSVLWFLGGIIITGVALRYLSYTFSDPKNYQEYFFAVRAPFHSCWEPLALGVAIAFAMSDERVVITQSMARRIFVVSLIALLFLLGSFSLMADITVFDATLQPVLIALIMAALVLGAVAGGAFKWFSHPLLVIISRLSYSLYLVHYILAPICYVFLLTTPLASANIYVFVSVFFLFYTTLSIASALLLYYLVERPFLRIKDKV